jgi:predicted unusual protein kinase regulating ubiquinone biosynthesis (AarF/ABC1/UbiB family)
MPGYGAALQATGQVIGGLYSYFSSKDQARLLEEQGAIEKNDYYRHAKLVREQGYRVRAQQVMAFISAGVEMVGTPQLVTRETISRARVESEAYKITGRNVERLYNQKAKTTKEEGRMALLTSIINAGASMAGGG